MRRLWFVFLAMAGCVEGQEEGAELTVAAVEDEAIDGPTDPTFTAPPAHAELDVDPLGARCGVPIGAPLKADWVLGDHGVPRALEIEPDAAVDSLTVELHVLDGATLEVEVIERVATGGLERFELPTTLLDDAADFAAAHGVPFGSVSATVFAHDAAGRPLAAGDAPAIHFTRDASGTLTGRSPREAASAPELARAYPEAVVLDGVDPADTYIRVFTSNRGE